MVHIITAPLRDRPEDIKPLSAEFLDRLGVESGLGRKRLSAAALRLLASCSWPGNVRQLQNILERAALFADAEEIGKADLLPLLDDSRELTAPGESLEEIGEAGLLPLLEPGKIVGGSHARAAVPRAAAARDLPVAAATDSACDGPRVCHASQPACCADREGALPTLAECECRLIQAALERVRLQQDRGSRHAPRRSPPARAECAATALRRNLSWPDRRRTGFAAALGVRPGLGISGQNRRLYRELSAR